KSPVEPADGCSLRSATTRGQGHKSRSRPESRIGATQSAAAASIRIPPCRSHAMPLFRRRAIPLLLSLLLSLLLACPAAMAADTTARMRVAGVAQAIEDHYFDAGRGR